MSVANIIFQQLGGNLFAMMTGSKNFVATDEYTLQCKLARNKSSAQYMSITLNGKDLYDIKFFKVDRKTLDRNIVCQHNDIYCDQLQDIFTKTTGLYTTLKG